jgi:hypothetical protein
MAKKEIKTKFSEDIINKIIKLAAHGVKNEDIENILQIEKGSIEQYAKKTQDFSREMQIAPVKIDIEVEKALFRRAVGYETTEDHWIYTPVFTEGIDEPELKLKEIRKVKKFVPADASSALIWLYNRMGERWSKNPAISSNETYEDYIREKKLDTKEAKENM